MDELAPPGRAFSDVPATRKAVYDGVLSTISKIPPLTNSRHTLALTDLDWEDDELVSPEERKKAVLSGNSLERRLRGTFALIDNQTQKPLSTRRMTVARVPMLTDEGTYVLNGINWSLANQSRLRPGVFVRRGADGEIVTNVNPDPGTGAAHKYEVDRKGVFKIRIQNATIPLLPALRALGASDDAIRAKWGDEVFKANAAVPAGTALEKLADKFNPKRTKDRSALSIVQEAFLKTPLDTRVTKRTLGRPHPYLTADAMLDATEKMLRLSKNEVEPDDRDAMVYQRVLGPEDMFAERAKQLHKILRPYFWRASGKASLDPIVPNFFGQHLRATVTESGLGQAGEEVNPIETLGQLTRISRLGYGGIPSIRSAPEDSRAVQPSQLGFIDPTYTPESASIGLDSRLAANVRKGPNGDIFTRIIDVKTGKPKWANPEEISDGIVAFPGELDDPTNDMVRVLRDGRLDYADRSEVTHAYPDMEEAFNPLTQLIPYKSADKANRSSMGARMTAQAVPLTRRESPLVLPTGSDGPFHSLYAKYAGVRRAESPGVVTGITKHSLTVKQDDGTTRTYPLYDNHVLNRKSLIRSLPSVRVGQRVGKNDLLASSNYADDDGKLALGANLRVAYVPFRDKTYEDAVVVSESTAREKLTSEHAYQFDVDLDDTSIRKGKSAFSSLFPGKYNRSVMEQFDDDGVIKVGTTVTKDMPLVLKAKTNEYSHGKVSRGKQVGFIDQSEIWDHEDEGTVLDVVKTKKGVNVVVSSLRPFREGDKLSGLRGDKGLAAAIVPDDEMPVDKDGRPFEILVNPLTVVTRQNAGQMVEAALGKIAAKTGKPYEVRDWGRQNLTRFALDELARHGLEDKEDIRDPKTGETIPGVFTGVRYYMKLHHLAETKESGRGLGAYTQTGAPAKTGGKEGSAKRLALMDTASLLSHGAFNLLRGVKEIRGQKNADFWAAFMAGRTAPPPQVSVHHERFLNQLRAGGINPVRTGTKISLKALTDADVDEKAGDREITSPETVDFKSGMKPIKGGLFDEGLTGGPGEGNLWSKISLAEPLPNPAFEEPIRRVLGLTQKDLRKVIAGEQEFDGKTGPGAIRDALAAIDVDAEIDRARRGWKAYKGANRDKLVKRWAMLAGAKRQGLHPKDWVSTKVPVLPPRYRPISVMTDNGLPLVSDANYLYGDVLRANDALKSLTGRTANVGEERLALYDAYKAAVGLGDPITPKNQERGVKGVLKSVFGSGPKYSAIQYRLLGGAVDTVGRAVIIPSNDLDMDEIGLPEAAAWQTFAPFIVRRLVRRGVAGPRAVDMVERKDPIAKQAMIEEMDERPVVATRAPNLHRYSIMGFRPRLVAGNAIKLPPPVTKGMGADHDGDAINWHVPVSKEEVDEVYDRMLPSRNLIAVRNFKVHQLPNNEFSAGIFRGTNDVVGGRPKAFASYKDLLRAWRQGKIRHSDPVEILDR